MRILKFIVMQLKFTWYLVKSTSQTKITFFFLEGRTFLLPILAARLAGKKPIIVVTHSLPQISRQTNKNGLLTLIMLFLERINNGLAKKMIVYSPNMCRLFNLEKYKDKIIIAHEHFLDFDKFKIKRGFGQRDNLVGYIGRLSEEKGVLNFVKAIPEISKEKGDLEFLIGGEGQLRDEIEEYLENENLNGKVELTGWIPHDELPKYLNELKLLILPSYTEGLPNIMLEAMACGTPVLATSVGAIPDVIKDGETGFIIMEDNSPECIARNVIRALNHPNLEQIARNARALVEREFTFEKAVERYREILSDLSNER
ncbi:MAG: Alpha-D-kanosaminyltransferase [Syntrophomonadaceae bacterium]|nr:Alpha-D-kanosaminyltransferase [Bacillota bacterium]